MGVKAIDLDNLDQSVRPADNFYQFANGGWLKSNPIPSEYSRWGAFEELNELSLNQLRAILEECDSDVHTTNPNRRAIAILFSTGMDEATCASHGLDPLADVFTAIDAVETGPDIVRLAARLQAQCGVHPGLFSFYSLPDAKNSAWEVIALSQSSSLGIGDRDFYFRSDKEAIREKYVLHVSNTLRLAACSQGNETEQAQLMFDLETKLAESCMTKTERRDPVKTYNKFEGEAALAEATSPDKVIPWADYFSILGLPEPARKTIVVDNPSFLQNLSSLLTETPIDTWKTYMRYHVLKDMAAFVSPAVEQENFSFFGKAMTGQPEMKARWKRVLNLGVTALIEDSLGIEYTTKHFSPAAKSACLDLVNVLIGVWKERITELDWMQQETKDRALQKLSNFRPMIGYPNRWDVDDMPQLVEKLSRDQSYCANVRACNVRNFRKVIERIDKPVDGDRWEMPSTLVNAYFHPLKNVIVFPAAILQPPFFYHPTEEQPFGDPAINFSAIGAVICHEISHGYDDQGRKFDSKGELVDWWTEADASEYERRASAMEKLCSDYKFFGKNLNGKLCLGENIADYGGIKLSYQGLQNFQKEHGELDAVDGFSAEQRFFLGWASIWRNNIREEMAHQRIITDPHAPGEFRANVVQVLEEFHEAFEVKEGDGMWQASSARCGIW